MWTEFTTHVSFKVKLHMQKLLFTSLIKQIQTQQKMVVVHIILKLGLK